MTVKLPNEGDPVLIGTNGHGDWFVHRVDYQNIPSVTPYAKLTADSDCWPLMLTYPRLSWKEGLGACVQGRLYLGAAGLPPWDSVFDRWDGVALASFGQSLAVQIFCDGSLRMLRK